MQHARVEEEIKRQTSEGRLSKTVIKTTGRASVHSPTNRDRTTSELFPLGRSGNNDRRRNVMLIFEMQEKERDGGYSDYNDKKCS